MSEFYTHFSKKFDHVFVRGYRNGKRFNEKIKYSPYHFVPSKLTDTKYKSVDGMPLDRLDFDSISEARKFVKDYSEVAGFPIFGSNLYEYCHINDHYDDIQYDPSLIRVGNYDIETDSEGGYGSIETANKAIISIALKVFNDNQIHVFGTKPYESEIEHPVEVIYHQARNEKEMLIEFINCWVELDFDIITGWNIQMYDIPYMIRRIEQVLGVEWVKKLSPYGQINTREVTIFNKPTVLFEISGISTVDYLDTYKKFSFSNEESYKLDYILKKVLNRGKLDYSEYGTLAKLYEQNYNKFIDYNIIDVLGVEDLDKVQKFMDQIFSIAYFAKVNFNDTFATVRIWDVMIHNFLLAENMAVPKNEEKFKSETIMGAYVKQPNPQRYKWIASFDLTSLYPHIIMMYNVSPEKLVTQIGGLADRHTCVDQILDGFLKQYRQVMIDNNVTVSGKGTVFKRDSRGFIPTLMKNLFNLRKVYKKQMIEAKTKLEQVGEDHPDAKSIQNDIIAFHNKQMAIKILLNSGYGALTNVHMRWYDNALAETITISGQLSIRWIERVINDYLNQVLQTKDVDYIVAIDTDSCYVNFDPIVKRAFKDQSNTAEIVQFIDNFCEKSIIKVINDGYQALYDEVNAFEGCMDMKREVIAETAIWTGKKHYCMKIWDMEGVRYSEPHYKVMGLDAIKSSTPAVARAMQYECIKLILDGDERRVKKFIDQCYETFQTLPFDQMASPRSVSELDKHSDPITIYRKNAGVPTNSRGSLLYNHYIKHHNVADKYQMINAGDKIRYSYLLTPNPIGENVIAAPDQLPVEFGLHPYIDYYKQFDKTFLNSITDLAHSGGMRLSSDTDISAFEVPIN